MTGRGLPASSLSKSPSRRESASPPSVDDNLSGYLVSCRQGLLWNLRNIAVAEAHRRCGVGSALLRALLETELVAGSHIYLEVCESECGAIALYERLGFRDRQDDASTFVGTVGRMHCSCGAAQCFD